MTQDHDHTEQERRWRWDHLMAYYELEQMFEPIQADVRTLHLARRCGLEDDFQQYLQEKSK